MRKAIISTGQELHEMFEVASTWLEKSVPEIDALNVFPVPDGDCGTNMMLTLRSAVDEPYNATDGSVSAAAQAMARGALMGARGNSGVILSQILRGFAKSLENKEHADGNTFASALSEGTAFAYKALSHPTEGTILTVVRESADAARKACVQNADLDSVLESVVRTAQDSVANTPYLLPILRETGVVDAGGQGLCILLDGMMRYVRGEEEELKYRQPRLVPTNQPLAGFLHLAAEGEAPYGYCTEFVLEGTSIDLDIIRGRLESEGQCLIVVGDEHLAHIHIHTLDPGSVLHYATSLGTLHELKIENMDDQHKRFLETTKGESPATDIATVAVVSGKGLTEVFQTLGVTTIVAGGPTMSPSTQELLKAVESVPQENVIIMPNDKNIIPTAKQVYSLTTKNVTILPTVNITQGVAALLSFNREADLETNLASMQDGISPVKTIEITQAIRSTQVNGLRVQEGQSIGFSDGELVAVNDKPSELLWNMLSSAALKESAVITIYYGNDTTPSEANDIATRIRQQYPMLQIDLIYGGQPHYDYIVSLE